MLWTIFILNKSKRYQRSDIKDNGKRHQLVRCYDVSKRSVSFSYQLKRLCNVLRWSVWLRYQFVHRYNVSDWSVLFTYLQDITKVSHIGPTFWRTNWDVVMMSQHSPGRPNWPEKWFYFSWVLGSTFFGISGGSVSLTHSFPMHPFSNPWKHQKIVRFSDVFGR